MRKLGKLHCGSDAAEIESRRACELNRPRRGIAVRHGLILVGQASACLVLIFAEAEVKRTQAEQAAEKGPPLFVIPSEARNLSFFPRAKSKRDSSLRSE
jgi:hypothetical protein